MMYDLGMRKSVEKAFFKLAKRNPKQLEAIFKKIEEIRRGPSRFKNLRSPLQRLKRVHIDRSHVVLFSVDESRKMVIIEAYDHHDKIYKQ